jgi:hypothetical protein
MHTWDVIGYVASTLVLTAFGMKSIIPLRVVAMCSNVVFIIYGLGFDLTPIWSLHAALLPMNAWRLVEALEVVRKLQARSHSVAVPVHSGTPALRMPSKKSSASSARLNLMRGRSVPEIV